MVDATTATEIETAVVRFGEAWANGDVMTLDTMLSPTFTHTDINGRFTDRAAWLATAHRRPNASTVMDDIAIRTFGDIAIVTARQIIMHEDEPERRRRAFRITAVLIRQQGRWLREAAQVAAIADLQNTP
jgi:ketosteroid isomerase-like protein